MDWYCRRCHAELACVTHYEKIGHGAPWSRNDRRFGWGPCDHCDAVGIIVNCHAPVAAKRTTKGERR